MMHFCWALVIITAVIGPFSNGAEDRKKALSRAVLDFLATEEDRRHLPGPSSGSNFATGPFSNAAEDRKMAFSRAVLDFVVAEEDRRHLPGPSSGSNFATVDGQDVTRWFGDELNQTLKTGLICDAIPDDASITWSHTVRNKNNWHDGWWSWFELYGGRFTCSDSGLDMDGDCDPHFNKYRATCYVTFTGVRMSSSWRVAVRNPQHDGHFVIIEAGHVNATMDVLHAVLEIDRDRNDSHLYINDVDPDFPDIDELVFESPTIALRDKEIDTNDQSFQELVRRALCRLVDFFLMHPFLSRLEEALLEAKNKTSEASQPK